MKASFIFTLLITSSLFAKDLVGSVNKLAVDATNLGYAVAGFGIVLAAFYLMTGRADGKEKLTMAISGSIVIALAQSIINFVRGIS